VSLEQAAKVVELRATWGSDWPKRRSPWARRSRRISTTIAPRWRLIASLAGVTRRLPGCASAGAPERCDRSGIGERRVGTADSLAPGAREGSYGRGGAGAQAELAAWKLTEAKRTVERYPNDFPARLALGELLLAAGQVDAALAQFQQAQKGPQVRVAALVGLGRGFKAKKIFDLAVMQFTTAKAELAAMDDVKKAVVYELGAASKRWERREEAIAEFKLIYGEVHRLPRRR